ncbi:hypothetical protein MKW92_029841 [Papaver armeniacum]|nr:hypothetical protein MKW92_029841 [Papaver armeniacum]
MDHGSEGFAAEVMDIGEETKNLEGHTCDNCGKISDHWTTDCRSTHRDHLRWLCSTYGPVARVAGPEMNGMKDQGLVAFENKIDAQLAIQKLNGSTFKGHVITVEWALKEKVLKENRCRRCVKIDDHSEKDCPWVVYNPIGKYVHNTIRVRNFAGETDRSDISSLCGTFGPIACVFEPGLYYEGKGHLGLAIAFENKEDAQKAIEKLNGSLFKGRVLTVEWARRRN